jgi:malonate transporter and related proteins
MQAVVDVVLPVFGLIFTGLLAGRFGLLGQDSTEALNKFVYWFALPALFFVGMSRVPVAEVFNVAYIAAFLGGVVISALVVAVVARFAFPQRPEETAMASYIGAFSNSGYMGIPFFLTAFGAAGQLPVIIASVLNGAVVVSSAAIALELTIHRDRAIGRALGEVGKAIVTNPLMVAMGGGIVWSATGLAMPKPFTVFFDLLGACAGPCALFAVGLFLAGQNTTALFDRRRSIEVGWISFVKLVVQPLATWVVGAWLGLSPFWLACAVISAAFPAGATAFVLAQRYKVYIERTSAVILLSTILSLVTLSALMVILDPKP